MDEEYVHLLVKSCIVSSKGGVLVKNINYDFVSEFGKHIPYKAFGHSTLEEYLQTLKDIRIEKNQQGEDVLRAVENEKNAHILSLVRRQKNAPSRKKKKFPQILRKRFTDLTSNVKEPEVQKIISPFIRKEIEKQNTPIILKHDNGKELKNERENRKEKAEENTKEKVEENRKEKVEKNRKEKVDENRKEKENRNKISGGGEGLKLKSLMVTITRSSERKVQEYSVPLSRLKNNSRKGTFRPSIGEYVLFGDNYFVEFAKNILGYSIPKTENQQSVSMIRKGLNLREARNIFLNQSHYPEKIVVMLGAVDIMCGFDFENIAYNYCELARDMINFVEEIVICTIPPLFFDYGKRNPMEVLLKTNELIKYFPEDLGNRVRIVDLYKAFTKNTQELPLLNFYNKETYLWNELGCKLVNKIFEAKLE